MTLLESILLFFAGVGAGMINSVVGSGSLLTFPTMIAIGFPPVVANITGNVGVLPGSFAGAFAYRKFFAGSGKHLIITALFSAVGGAMGAVLILSLPPEIFSAIVPILIGLAVLLVIFGPTIKKAVLKKSHDIEKPDSRFPLYITTALTGVYGGYFGAGQGIILLSFLSLMIRGGIQRANAYKNVLAGAGNLAATVVFLFFADIAWNAAILIMIGSLIGGIIGGRYGQRIPELAYRIFIVTIGIVAITYFVLN